MKTQMTSDQAMTLYSTIEALCNQFDRENQKEEIMLTEALTKGIGDARQAAMQLCWQIEKCGASDELTKASVMASKLTEQLNELLPEIA